jgi:uncharacterized integral membrane protein
MTATEDPRPARRRHSPDRARLIGVAVAVVVLVAFVLDNSQQVRVGFVLFHASVSLIWVILIAALLGALVERLATLVLRRRKAARRPG